MKKMISTKLTEANVSLVMTLLVDIPVKLAHLSEGLSHEQVHQPLATGERTVRETLAHLLHCEARSTESIYLALLVDEPLFINIHPERQLGQLVHYEQYDFADLLSYFAFRRTALLNVLTGLTEAQWSRTIREAGKKRQESVYWRARALALHEWEHVVDMERKLGV